jgi:hypothetical protein
MACLLKTLRSPGQLTIAEQNPSTNFIEGGGLKEGTTLGSWEGNIFACAQ